MVAIHIRHEELLLVTVKQLKLVWVDDVGENITGHSQRMNKIPPKYIRYTFIHSCTYLWN